MFYHQSIFEYMDNPMGKGSTAIANRGLIRENLNQRYDKLMAKHKDFECRRYFDGTKFYFHILVPTESERNNTYDVVIELSDPLGDFTKDITLNRYVMRVFSNCPSFVFTYAYAYNKYGMLIDTLMDKYTDITLENAPSIKNPGEIINYEKSVYFACKYLTSHKALMNKVSLMTTSSVGMQRNFEKIRTTDRILLEIRKENRRIADEKKATKVATKQKITKREDPNRKTPTKKFSKNTGTRRVTPHAKVKARKKIK